VQRKELLQRAGIDTTHLTNIDLIDAALCTYVAYLVAVGAACASYGEAATGLIIVPELKSQGG
jgi:predicted RNase H-like nuclease